MRKNKFGLSVEQYNERYAIQEGKCSICQKERKLVVDHDHKTGIVRGLLCHACNSMLGFAGEDQETLSRASLYLNSSKWFSGKIFVMKSECFYPIDGRANLSDMELKRVSGGLNN